MKRRRWLLAAVAGLPLAAVAVLAVEVEVARRGENLDEAALGYPEAGTTTAVWIGDSTAVGVGVTDGSLAVAGRVARARGERVVMLGVSGATLADVVAEQVPRVAAHRPDRIYVSVGANDVTHLTRSRAFEDGYRELLRRLPGGVDVVVLGVPDMGAPPRLHQPLRAIAGFRGRHLDDVVEDVVAGRDGVTHVDIAGRTGPPFREDPDRYFAGDGYHPGADGYRLWAEAVLETVAP